jgi:hypothetical protein
MEVYIDDVLDGKIKLPMKNSSRKLEPTWKYQMTEGKHKLRLKWLNPSPEYEYRINDLIVYSQSAPKSNLPLTAH